MVVKGVPSCSLKKTKKTRGLNGINRQLPVGNPCWPGGLPMHSGLIPQLPAERMVLFLLNRWLGCFTTFGSKRLHMDLTKLEVLHEPQNHLKFYMNLKTWYRILPRPAFQQRGFAKKKRSKPRWHPQPQPRNPSREAPNHSGAPAKIPSWFFFQPYTQVSCVTSHDLSLKANVSDATIQTPSQATRDEKAGRTNCPTLRPLKIKRTNQNTTKTKRHVASNTQCFHSSHNQGFPPLGSTSWFPWLSGNDLTGVENEPEGDPFKESRKDNFSRGSFYLIPCLSSHQAAA